jgi:polynucleotide 5'-kinase involved in rRNA processing
MRGEMLAKILRRIATAVEDLDDSQLEKFIVDLKRGNSTGVQAKENKTPLKNRHSKVDLVELENVLENLSRSLSREEGAHLLDRVDLNRKELEKLARLRNIHVTKYDNIAKIKEKLVEVIIGSRLSSRAIRGQ